MLVTPTTPFVWPPHDHGATYRSHYNGHFIVRVNWKPRALHSTARNNWLRVFAATMQQRPLSMHPNAVGGGKVWAQGWMPLAQGGVLPTPTAHFPTAVSPAGFIPTLTATRSLTRVSWGAVDCGPFTFRIHVDLRPGFDYQSRPSPAHFTAQGSKTLSPGTHPGDNITLGPIPYITVGETVSAIAFVTQGTLPGTERWPLTAIVS